MDGQIIIIQPFNFIFIGVVICTFLMHTIAYKLVLVIC